MKRIVIALVLIAVVVGIFLIVRPAKEEAAETPAALTVSLVGAEAVSWPETLAVSGGIEAWQEAVIGAEVNGLRLDEVRADVGDAVKKGQLLAHFDDATLRAAVAQQKASVAQAEAALAEAASNAARAETLRETGALSEQEINSLTTQAVTAKASLEAAKAQLDAQEVQLRYTRVVAPDDGIISSRTATLGSVAGAGAELFRLVRQNRLEWRAELTGEQLVKVRPGAKVRFTLPDGAEGEGTVRQLAPVLDDATRTAIAYIDLNKAVMGARAGMYVNGHILLADKPGLALPQGSIIRRDGFEYVFMLAAENRVELHKVATGRRDGALVEILSGLEPGQKVVGTGAGFLNDGDTVRVVEPAGAEAAK